MKNKKFLVILVIIFIILYLVQNVKYYNNNYLTVKQFESNQNIYNEIINDIKSENIEKINIINKSCESITGYCSSSIKLKNNLMQEDLGILHIKKSSMVWSEDFNIIFYLNKKKYIQYLNPVLEYNSEIGNDTKSKGWYFPLSNKYFYIGTPYIYLGNGWSSYGYLDSAFN